MDQRPGPRRRGGGDMAGAVDVDGVEIPLQDSDQIDDGVAPKHRGAHRRGVANVGAGELDLADRGERLQEEGPARVALDDAKAGAGSCQRLDGVAAEEAAAAEECDHAVARVDRRCH
jgi:hypothetical protein